jgi:hypothetical protein
LILIGFTLILNYIVKRHIADARIWVEALWNKREKWYEVDIGVAERRVKVKRIIPTIERCREEESWGGIEEASAGGERSPALEETGIEEIWGRNSKGRGVENDGEGKTQRC